MTPEGKLVFSSASFGDFHEQFEHWLALFSEGDIEKAKEYRARKFAIDQTLHPAVLDKLEGWNRKTKTEIVDFLAQGFPVEFRGWFNDSLSLPCLIGGRRVWEILVLARKEFKR